ncbi:MAG TPA: tRNA adenosine(34) deaminase TadA [Syntrophales bacterium]|nr:tRNA adenosine(34) deaminase TadA [Syntrophales bacterium]HPQ42686.1 tRNA adenosine(34) deaminase TadA [Syntrophales bacterium]
MQGDEYFMRMALSEAESALELGEVPVGAVITMEGRVLAKTHNSPILMNDPTAHAEMLAIREAADRTENYRLNGATLYVTIEPCPMCAGAIVHARIARLVFGATDLKGGALSLYDMLRDRKLNHTVEITGGVLQEKCGEILSRFFRKKRI